MGSVALRVCVCVCDVFPMCVCVCVHIWVCVCILCVSCVSLCVSVCVHSTKAPGQCLIKANLFPPSFLVIRVYGEKGTHIALLNAFIIKEERLFSGVSVSER